MEAHLPMVLSGIARSVAPSGLKKTLFFRVELALRDDGAVRSIPQARGQQWPLQQRLVPEMVEQLVEVPKVRCQDGIQQRTAEQIVALGAPVLPERITERISEQSEVIEVTETSSQDRKLQRTVEQDSVGVDKNCPQYRISERIRFIEVPKISCQECVACVLNHRKNPERLPRILIIAPSCQQLAETHTETTHK